MENNKLPANKVFLNMVRSNPGGNQYNLTVAIRLDGYEISEYDPEKKRYDRAGGVKYRNTTMVLKKSPGHKEFVTRNFRLTPNRKEEDSIYINLEIQENPLTASTDSVQAQQRTPDPPAGQQSGGGTGGSYEP